MRVNGVLIGHMAVRFDGGTVWSDVGHPPTHTPCDSHGPAPHRWTRVLSSCKFCPLHCTPAQEGRIQTEKRLQQVEGRQAEVERQLAALAAAQAAAAAEAAAALEDLRQGTKAMLSEVIGRIAGA